MEVRRKPESASSSVPIQAIIQERLLDGSTYDSVSVQMQNRLSEDMENFALQIQSKRTMLREVLSLEPS